MPRLSHTTLSEWTDPTHLIHFLSREVSDMSHPYIIPLSAPRDSCRDSLCEYGVGAALSWGILYSSVGGSCRTYLRDYSLRGVWHAIHGSSRWSTRTRDVPFGIASRGCDTPSVMGERRILVFPEYIIPLGCSPRRSYPLQFFLPPNTHTLSDIRAQAEEVYTFPRHTSLVFSLSIHTPETPLRERYERWGRRASDVGLSRGSAHRPFYRSLARMVSLALVSRIHIYIWCCYRKYYSLRSSSIRGTYPILTASRRGMVLGTLAFRDDRIYSEIICALEFLRSINSTIYHELI